MQDACRAVIHTADGQRIATRWRPNKHPSKLGPDEFPPIMRAISVATRYIKRKGLKGCSIGAEYVTRKEDA